MSLLEAMKSFLMKFLKLEDSHVSCAHKHEFSMTLNKLLFQVTDSHSVDVEALRKKSVGESPSKSSVVNLSQVNLTDTVHPVVGSGVNNHRGKTFENGDVIVTLLPVNERFPWVTPAKFRPELVPEELMAPSLSVSLYLLLLASLLNWIFLLFFSLLWRSM